MTTVSNASESAGEHSGEGDVSITIKGHTAAQMLGRGDAKVRELEDLVGALQQQLEQIGAAIRQQSGAQGQLEQHVAEAQGKLTLLVGQVADQGTELRGGLVRLRAEAGELVRQRAEAIELARVRAELNGQSEKLARLQATVDALAMTLAQIEQRLDESQAAAEAAAAAPGRISALITSAADRIKRLHLSLW